MPGLLALTGLPLIYVGAHAIISIPAQGSDAAIESYEQALQEFGFIFETQIVCEREDLATVWTSLKDALIDWYPVPNDKNYSGVSHFEGGIMGMENTRLWWLDRWKINFPRT